MWWELSLPIVATLVFIWLFKMPVEYAMKRDTEYRGSLITEARYYEYWEEWVHRTCTRKVGKVTVTYDCSYCSEHPARWEVVDNYGNKWDITESYYKQLMSRWSATPKFVELNRSINHHGSCGKDGDMYAVNWDHKILTSEPAVTLHSYENKVQVSHNAFKLPYVAQEEAKKLGLYEYPERFDQYKQHAILGIDSLYPDKRQVRYINKYFDFLNGYYGVHNHVKVFVLFFFNKIQLIAHKQEAYWDGGNDNEVVVCIGIDPKMKKMGWVKSFGWCDNKRVHVEIRERLMEHPYFDFMHVYTGIIGAVKEYYKPKDFSEFDYLEVDLPTWAYWVEWILVIALTFGICRWAIRNEITY